MNSLAFKEHLLTLPKPISIDPDGLKYPVNSYEMKLRDLNKRIAECLIDLGECDRKDKLNRLWKKLQDLKTEKGNLKP